MVDLKYGPLNKSLYTQQLELVAKCLLHAPDKIELNVVRDNQGKKALTVKVGEVSINLHSLFAKANMTHVQLNENDSNQYVQKSAYYRDENITRGEYEAIQQYTGSAYIEINKFLYNGDHAVSDYASKEGLKDLVLKTVFLG